MNAPSPTLSPFTTGQAPDPIEVFRHWLAEAAISEPNDPNAMALATATPEGRPSLRMVLLKGLDERGFAFYTNGDSRKGQELAANPHAAVTFHWKTRRRQVRVEGPITQLPPEDADHYFHSRSHGSQISAAASLQSRPVASREALEAAASDLAARYPGEVPRPDHWLGYALQPAAIEFWQDGPNRLHDRILYAATGQGWTTTRLYP